MNIEFFDCPETQKIQITVTIDRAYIENETHPLPEGIREMMTIEQSFGIISDACLMALGLEEKRKTQ
ncbi:MAG TPA: hypothetical protein PLX33_10445 [Alphaproteobacteria bacterium]|nr:hypothetical protein [Alphaproteobacteria bacterium]